MFNEERSCVRIRVVDSNTGEIIRSKEILSSELLSRIACKEVIKDSTVVVSSDNIFYCFYINGETYFCSVAHDSVIINLFEEVISGAYDYARDAYHIQYGRVIALLAPLYELKYTELLTCIDNIWNTRYYRIAYGQ